MNKYAKELDTALNIVEKVAVFQLENQNKLDTIILKNDLSPVTFVDQQSEELIKSTLLSTFVEDGFLGEESSEVVSKNGRKWIVDPLDGTRPYIKGIPTFSTLIALEENGEIVLGVVSFPALKETYYACKNFGAYCNGNKIEVSKTNEISKSMVSALGAIELRGQQHANKLLDLMQKTDYIYGFMDAYSYTSVACGKLDAAFGLLDNSWDRAPIAIIIKEAGGDFSNFNGKNTIYDNSFFVSNKRIHNEILQNLK